jgi:hypothetical protein
LDGGEWWNIWKADRLDRRLAEEALSDIQSIARKKNWGNIKKLYRNAQEISKKSGCGLKKEDNEPSINCVLLFLIENYIVSK